MIEKAKVCIAVSLNDEPLDNLPKITLQDEIELRHNISNELQCNQVQEDRVVTITKGNATLKNKEIKTITSHS